MSPTDPIRPSSTPKVFCFGELLLRMSPVLNKGWIDAAQMPVYIGGAELNVARALVRWQTPATYCTALPDHHLSHEIISSLQDEGVDTTPVIFRGDRIGIYYLPQGTDLKHGGVIYDRAHSSFSGLMPGTIDHAASLEGSTWFHCSAISPALNANVATVTLEALKAAASKGITTSIDLNYRAKLWQYGKHPAEVMPALVRHCHVLMGNIWAVESLLGIKAPIQESTGRSKEELIAAARQSMEAVLAAYPAVNTIAFTFRLDASYFGVLHHKGELYISREHVLTDIVDKVGSGDCFMGGLIHGLLHGHDPQHVIGFAAAAAVGKLKEVGDATRQTVSQIEATM